MARRKGEEWFIGSITNNDARTLPVDLSFLPAGKDYVAEIYTDGENLFLHERKSESQNSVSMLRLYCILI